MQGTTRDIGGLRYVPMGEDEAKLFMLLSVLDEDKKGELLADIAKNSFVFNVAKRNYMAHKIVSKTQFPEIKDEVLALTLVFCGGNPGKANLFLIDLLGRFNGKLEITWDDAINTYPWGFYDGDTCKMLIDGYLKPRKLLFSEMY